MAKFKIDKEKLNSKSINRSVRFDSKMYERLERLSVENGVSFNKIVKECIAYALSHM